VVPEHTGQKNVSRIFPVTINSNAIDRTGESSNAPTQDAGVTTSVRNTTSATTPPKRKRTPAVAPTPPPAWAVKQAADIQLNLRPDPYATKKQLRARERTLRHAIARKIQVLQRMGKRTEWRTKKEAKLERALGKDVTVEHLTNQPPPKANKLTNIIGPSAHSEQPSLEVVVLPTPLIWGFNSISTTPTPYFDLDNYRSTTATIEGDTYKLSFTHYTPPDLALLGMLDRPDIYDYTELDALMEKKDAHLEESYRRAQWSDALGVEEQDERADMEDRERFQEWLDWDDTPATPTVTMPVRATSTRFKEHLPRVLAKRHKVHERLMSDPKSAPSRKQQNRWLKASRRCGRAAKLIKQQQEQEQCTYIAPTYTRHQIKVATERLRRFVVFLQKRMAIKRAQEMAELYSPDSDDGASDNGASDNGASGSDAASYCTYKSWRNDKSWRSDGNKRRFTYSLNMDDLWKEYVNSY